MEACEQPYMWLHICLNLLSIGAYRSERKEKKVAWNPEEAEDEEEEIPRTCWHRDPVAVFWHPGRVLNSELSSPANHKLSEKSLLQAQARPMEIAAKTQFFTSVRIESYFVIFPRGKHNRRRISNGSKREADVCTWPCFVWGWQERRGFEWSGFSFSSSRLGWFGLRECSSWAVLLGGYC